MFNALYINSSNLSISYSYSFSTISNIGFSEYISNSNSINTIVIDLVVVTIT